MSTFNNNTVYLGENGDIVLEAENTRLQGNWKKTSLKGRSAIIYDGPNSFRKAQRDQTLSYTFETDKQGKYSIAIHSARKKEAMEEFASDLGNDIFIGIENVATGKVIQAPTKLFTYFGNANSKFRWGTKFDTNHKKSPAQVSLEANTQYRLLVAGRSDGFVIDRITLSNRGFLKKTNVPASEIKNAGATPVVPTPEPTPTPVPTPTPNTKALITLALVDAQTNQIVEGFENLKEKESISIEKLSANKKYNLIAQVDTNSPTAKSVKSIRFNSNLGNRTESVAPYALFGDVKGDFLGKILSKGQYSIKATAYTQAGGKGKAIASSTVKLAIVEPIVAAPTPPKTLVPQQPKDLTDLGAAPSLQLNPTPPKPTPPKVEPNPTPTVNNTPERRTITGTANNDRLIGVDLNNAGPLPGHNKKDILLGKQGADTFVLGDAQRMFYNDGNSKTAGKQDFARIIDFSLEQGDIIQLHGKAKDYTLGALSAKSPQGTVGIFAENLGEKELIGIINKGQGLTLESAAFRFV